MDVINVPRNEEAVVRDLVALMRKGELSQANLSHTSRPYRVYSQADIRKRFAHRQGMGFAQPDLADVHIDVPLTNVSIAYRNPMYIGRQAVPTVPVVRESDKYFIFPRDAWLRDEAKIVPVGGRAPRGTYTTSSDNYSVDERGFEMPVPDRIRSNSDSVIGPDRNATNMASDKVDIAYEKSARDLLFTAANWGTQTATLSGSDQWSHADSTIQLDASAARQAVLLGCGFEANTCVMGYAVYETIMYAEELLNLIRYTGTSERPALVTPMMLAAILGVQHLLVGKQIENTAVEGATGAYSHIWTDKVWIGYMAEGPALETPSAAYIFSTGRKVRRYREEPVESDIAHVKEAWDGKITAAGAGFLYEDVLA